MRAEGAMLAVFEVAAQGAGHRAEGQIVPGDLGLVVVARFQALGAGIQLGAQRLRQVEHMHLLDLRHVDDGVDLAQFDAGAGFFQRFARRACAVLSPNSMKPAGSVQVL